MASKVLRTPEELLILAQAGQKLKPKQRLAVVVHLERTGKIDDYSEQDLAKTLSCSEQSLKNYRHQAKHIFAATISADEAMAYMAEFVRSYDILIGEARAGLKEAPKGGTGHQNYIRIIAELWDNKINKLQSVGVIPKELGRLTNITEEWVASASPEGVVSVNKVEPGSEGGKE